MIQALRFLESLVLYRNRIEKEVSDEMEQQSPEVKEMTPKQRKLLENLLDEGELRDKEIYRFRNLLEHYVSNSREASALISYILGIVQFRRQFGGK